MDLEIHYTEVHGGSVAYQVVGDGPRDVVYVPWFIGCLDAFWESPPIARFLSHISSIARLILLDRRGCGLSDTLPEGAPFIEEWCADAIGVMDAVGSERATLMAFDTGSPAAFFTAAANPDRVEGLLLMNGYARSPALDFPEHFLQRLVETTVAGWGNGDSLRVLNPELPESITEGFVGSVFARLERGSLRRGDVESTWRAVMALDASEVVDAVSVPTLMLHTSRCAFVTTDATAALAERIGAELVTLDSADLHGWLMQPDQVLPAIDRFMGGATERAVTDRQLATVLFSDISDSTGRAAAEGDHRWRSMLDSHDHLVTASIGAQEGRVVKNTGDGVLAVFSGPARAIHAAKRMREALAAVGIEIYQGLHVGEVELRGDDITGMAVNIAARVGAIAAPGEILVTRTVKDLVVGSGLVFEPRGAHELKGVPDTWELYKVS